MDYGGACCMVSLKNELGASARLWPALDGRGALAGVSLRRNFVARFAASAATEWINSMDNPLGRTIFYLFIMGLALILLGYYAGANQLLKTIFSGANTLDLTATGRNSAGQFATYPGNAPS